MRLRRGISSRLVSLGSHQTINVMPINVPCLFVVTVGNLSRCLHVVEDDSIFLRCIVLILTYRDLLVLRGIYLEKQMSQD